MTHLESIVGCIWFPMGFGLYIHKIKKIKKKNIKISYPCLSFSHLPLSPSRVVHNTSYRLCPTYPKFFVTLNSVSDDELSAIAMFRSKGRVPAVVWRHSRVEVLIYIYIYIYIYLYIY